MGGVPLIAHSIRQAQQSGLFAEIAVSSDSPEILAAAEAYGATQLVLRPAALATSTAGKLPAIRHCIEQVEQRLQRQFAIIADLDATSPLRIAEDIAGAIQLLENSAYSDANNVITGAQARRSPYFNMVERLPSGRIVLSKQPAQPILRRQDAPSVYDMNASVYVWRRECLLSGMPLFNAGTLLYEMPPERSVDLDCEADWGYVAYMMERRQEAERLCRNS